MSEIETRYNQQIAPLADEIKKTCNLLKIPCFLAFGVGLEEDGRFHMRGTCLLPEVLKIQANDRRFTDLVNVQNGFITIAPEEIREEVIDTAILNTPALPDFEEELKDV